MVGPTLSFYPFLRVGNQDPKQGMISKMEKEEEPSLGEAKTTSPHSVSKIARPKKSGANESKFLVSWC